MYQRVVTGSMANVFQVNICLMPAGGTRGHALHRPQRTQLQHPSPQKQYSMRKGERETAEIWLKSANQTLKNCGLHLQLLKA